MDVLGAEGVDGDRRDERRVDAAGEPDHDVGEAVLGAVVAGAEDERLVQLGVRVEQLDELVVDRGLVAHRRLADDDRRQRPLRDPSTRVEQPLAVHGGHRDVDDHQLGRNCGPRASRLPSASNASEQPSKTSSSWPPTWLT